MTQMKSVGETMAIGRTFKESFQKALRGLEVGAFGFGTATPFDVPSDAPSIELPSDPLDEWSSASSKCACS